MANASTPAKTKGESRTFTEQVHKFQVKPEHRPQKWIVLTLPFSEAIKWLEPKTYNMLTNQGEQRPLTPSWVAKLYRDMDNEEYSNAWWAACFRKYHADRASFDEKAGTITFTVTSQNRLAHIDGNHRGNALLRYIQWARKVIEGGKASDEEKEYARQVIDLVNSCDISIQVYLDPEGVKDHFLHLQEGRPVPRSQQRVMKIRNKNLGDKQPMATMALKVALALNSNKDSHLHGLVALGESAVNLIGLDALTKHSASESSCTIYGGAEIAIHYGHDAKWLEDCYVEAFRIVEELTHAVELEADDGGVEREIPSVLQPGRILCPLGHYGGRKGGSTLLVGVGNLWAFYKAFTGRDEPTPADKERLSSSVEQVFDREFSGGLNAPLKRSLMGEFARTLFDGYVLGEEQDEQQGMVKGYEGIPLDLLTLISKSAFDVKIPKDTVLDGEGLYPEDGRKKGRGRSRKQLVGVDQV